MVVGDVKELGSKRNNGSSQSGTVVEVKREFRKGMVVGRERNQERVGVIKKLNSKGELI